jgi:hypothetical protein
MRSRGSHSKDQEANLYVFAVVFRLVWSLTIGIPIFLLGWVLFLILDIFAPRSDIGYRTLTSTFKFASCGWFKGVRVENDEYDVEVRKQRRA